MPPHPTTPPLALDPRAVSRHHGRDPRSQEVVRDSAVGELERAVAGAHSAAERLLAARVAAEADETRPPGARAAELRRLALEIGQRHAVSLDGAQAHVRAAVAQLEAETKAPPPRDALAAEIRTRLAGLPRDARAGAVESALAAGDQAVIGAVLGAPGFLSGLEPAQIEMIAARWRERQHPAAAARLRRLEHALDDAGRAGQAFLSFIKSATDSADAQKAEASAMAASQAIAAAKGDAA